MPTYKKKGDFTDEQIDRLAHEMDDAVAEVVTEMLERAKTVAAEWQLDPDHLVRPAMEVLLAFAIQTFYNREGVEGMWEMIIEKVNIILEKDGQTERMQMEKYILPSKDANRKH